MNMQVLETLQEKLSRSTSGGEEIQENVEMKKYTTFRLGGPAKYFFIAKSREDLITAVQTAKELGVNYFILGGGSNLLVSDKGYDGLMIKIEIKELKIDGQIIIAGAGVPLGLVVATAMQKGLNGMQWASGIPGTVGGAVRGNAGAYGSDTGKNAIVVEVYDAENNKIKKMTPAQCEFSYRESIFKRNLNLIVLSAEFQFTIGNTEEIKKEMLELTNKRICSQPKFPSVGCNFKNIVVSDDIREKIKMIDISGLEAIRTDSKTGVSKIGAAWFIDKAGLKGYQIGGAKVSDEHANFIVKFLQDGTTENVIDLINHIKKTVNAKYGLQLEEEVQYLGALN